LNSNEYKALVTTPLEVVTGPSPAPGPPLCGNCAADHRHLIFEQLSLATRPNSG